MRQELRRPVQERHDAPLLCSDWTSRVISTNSPQARPKPCAGLSHVPARFATTPPACHVHHSDRVKTADGQSECPINERRASRLGCIHPFTLPHACFGCIHPFVPSKASLANLKPAWTPEQAREAARLSNAAQALKRASTPETKADEDAAEELAATPDGFHARKLMRVRAQWNSLDRMIAAETEPAKLDRLIAALARIEEIERRLSSRSLPPTLRAPPERRGRNPGRSIEVWTAPPALPTPVCNTPLQTEQAPKPMESGTSSPNGQS